MLSELEYWYLRTRIEAQGRIIVIQVSRAASRGGGAFVRLATNASRKSWSSVKSGKPLVWLRSCLRVISAQAAGGGSGNSLRSSPMVSFKESAPLLTKESATAPLKALAMLAYAHVVVDPHGQPALYVADPEGVDLAVLAALHDGYDARRPAFHGDKFL